MVIVVGLVVAALAADRDRPSPPAPARAEAFGSTGAVLQPTADPSPALTSTWYCPGGPVADDASTDAFVTVSNHGDERRVGSVTWLPGEGRQVVVAVDVAAGSSVVERASTALAQIEGDGAVVASALVETEGGGVVVEHGLVDPRGDDLAPCASGASTVWHLANGSTALNASMVLALFNPFPDAAIVDVALTSEQGEDRVRGLPVPERSTVLVDVGATFRRRDVVALSAVARTGRVVVGRAQGFGPAGGRQGLDVTLAAPTPGELWTFPLSRADGSTTSRWHIYNPGQREAVVLVEVVPDEGEPPEPLERVVPPGARITAEAAEVGAAPGPLGSSTVRSINDVAVVAEREVDARSPSEVRGWSSSLGSLESARRWSIGVGLAPEDQTRTVVVLNPGTTPVSFSVDGGDGETIPPAARRTIEAEEADGATPLLVEADGPVVVGRSLVRDEGVGLSEAIAVAVP